MLVQRLIAAFLVVPILASVALPDHFLPPTNYPCQCNGYSGCPEDTCSNGCIYGWWGKRCQLRNLAYKRMANQSSTSGTFNASQAVDGLLPDPSITTGNAREVDHCSHTDDDATKTNSTAWWYVELGDTYAIVSVSLTKRVNDDRIKDFYILVGNSSSGEISIEGWSVCSYQNDWQENLNATYYCQSLVVGQRVGVLLTYKSEIKKNVIILCEFMVYGYAWKLMPLITEYTLCISIGLQNATLRLFLKNVTVNELVPTSVDVTFTERETRNWTAIRLNCSANTCYPFMLAAQRNYDLQVIPLVCNNSSYCQSGGGIERLDLTGSEQGSCDDTTNAALIGGLLGACLGLGAAAVGAAIFWKRYRRNLQNRHTILQEFGVAPSTTEEYANIDNLDSKNNSGRQSGMTLDEFVLYVSREEYIQSKFSELLQSEECCSDIGMKPENKSRNRFQNIVPYDVNRIILNSSPDNIEGYINASYIHGFSKERQYIATQGPTSKTFADFWRMVWQENCSLIIMLTSFFENGRKKCEEYFPFPQSPTCEIEISVILRNEYDGYSISELVLSQGTKKKSVTHCHYVSWPDHSVPESTAHFSTFRARVSQLNTSARRKFGPTVVHCSAGAGRTGAYIAIENLMQQFNDEGRVDIDSCIIGLRKQRMHMVQTKEQYIFVHHAVLYEILTQRFVIPKRNLALDRTPRSEDTELCAAEEWKVLQTLAAKWSARSYVTALKPENVTKNRSPSVLACDECRKFIGDSNSSTGGYINAVCCQGWYRRNAYLATQLPLPSTVADYWKLIYESKASSIIILDDITQSENCIQYLPSRSLGSEAVFAQISIKSSDNEQALKYFTCQNVVVATQSTEQTTHYVRLFKVRSQVWPATQEVPTTPELFIELLNSVRLLRRSHPDEPVVVQCLDGATRCGLCLAAFNCVDKLAEDGQVNVIHAVDILRTSQSKFITGQAQYEFLHTVVNDVLTSSGSNVYDNVNFDSTV